MKNILYTIILSFLFSSSVFGDDFQTARDAYQAGDYETSFRITKSLAEQGDVLGQYGLALLYYNGVGVTQDYKEAAKWYRKAAEQGDATGQYNLGMSYDSGEGVIQDFKEALKWYRKAAEQGYTSAQFALGASYYIGEGVVQNYVIAHMWFNISARDGSEGAKTYRDKAVSKMTSEDVEKAQKLARECIKKNYKNCD